MRGGRVERAAVVFEGLPQGRGEGAAASEKRKAKSEKRKAASEKPQNLKRRGSALPTPSLHPHLVFVAQSFVFRNSAAPRRPRCQEWLAMGGVWRILRGRRWSSDVGGVGGAEATPLPRLRICPPVGGLVDLPMGVALVDLPEPPVGAEARPYNLNRTVGAACRPAPSGCQSQASNDVSRVANYCDYIP